MSVKPILFNTEMVQAILDGRKTVTRRLVKPKYSNTHFEFKHDKYGTTFIELQNDVEGETYGKNEDGSSWHKLLGYIEPKEPCKKGDILWVRETWCDRWLPDGFLQGDGRYGYKADGEPSYGYWGNERQGKDNVWIPSLHMPKEAARIFLKVTDVRAERLQDITIDGIEQEGISLTFPIAKLIDSEHLKRFTNLWDSTIDMKNHWMDYSWSANPWVWVIEFERTEKPEGWCK